VIVDDVMTIRYGRISGCCAAIRFPLLLVDADPDGSEQRARHFRAYSAPKCVGRRRARWNWLRMATHIAGIAIERKRGDERIHFMAHHDDLTGLPNRAFFKERMAKTLHHAGATAARSRSPISISITSRISTTASGTARRRGAEGNRGPHGKQRARLRHGRAPRRRRVSGGACAPVSHDTGITRRLRELQKAFASRSTIRTSRSR
jgi:hypothetical protein